MNLNNPKYAQFHLCKEMLQTADVVRSFKPKTLKPFAELLRGSWDILLTGEGSSRIFPAKRAIHENHTEGWNLNLYTEGCTQALEYQLADTAVFGASNSGKTKELVRLFKKLQAENHPCFLGLTATPDSVIQDIAHKTRVLDCGKERAVAATKSVVEQALSYHAVFAELAGKPLKTAELSKAGDAIETALTLEIPADITAALAKAPIIYFAGRNDGVAEELTLKTNEITRKKSAFLEGTYAVHGIEEVMNPDEVVVLIDPFPEEEDKIERTLAQGVGMKVIAISSRHTRFPTIHIPEAGAYRQYVQLAAGWNLLVEIGLALNIAVDTPVRARKVGNEFLG
jgi:glucosamine--fructose-6-phosphate aminotransferase (isomerizing)